MEAVHDERECIRVGDAIEMLRNEPDESVDFVYLDPPFFTQNTQRGVSRADGRVRSYDDKWDSLAEYSGWIAGLLKETSRVLRPSGAIMVHCDWRASHHIRLALDNAFGPENFVNEIIWSYRRWTASRNSLQRLHQTIHYYAASPLHTVNVPMVDYSPTTNLDQIWHARTRDERGVATYKKENGRAISNGPKKGVAMGDVWEIPYLNPKAKERTGYPNQKPLELMERLLALAVRPGQRVLDPCCGSGTTLVAAQAMGCEFLGIDVSPEAVAVARTRLHAQIRTRSTVVARGRRSYERTTSDVDRLALTSLGAHIVQRNKLISGVLGPTGLQRLGLPANWSVAVALTKDGTPCSPAALANLAVKKQYDLILLFGDVEQETPSTEPAPAMPSRLAERVVHGGAKPAGTESVTLLASQLARYLPNIHQPA